MPPKNAARTNGIAGAPSIQLAPGAEANGLATMLADLVRQNIEAKPKKRADFDALAVTIAIVAEDAEVALTLRFDHGSLTIHDGIVGIPEVALRGGSDEILALSNMPISTPLALPFPWLGDAAGLETARAVMTAMRTQKLRVHGALFRIPALLHLTRLMSVNG